MRPIPTRILTQTATVQVPASMDMWQNITYTDYVVDKVHLQATNEVRKTKDNTEVVLRSILFVDARLSMPKLNYDALIKEAEANGDTMKVTVAGNTYTALSVDAVPDDTGKIHHWEVGLV